MWRNFSTWQMWRNLKFSTTVTWRNLKYIHIIDVENFISLHICHVEISKISPQFMWFCRAFWCEKICLRCFVTKSVLPRFMGFCVEKNWAKKFVCGEEMTNMRSAEEHQQRLGSVDAFIGSAQCLKWTLYNKDDFFSLGRQVRQPYKHTVREDLMQCNV